MLRSFSRSSLSYARILMMLVVVTNETSIKATSMPSEHQTFRPRPIPTLAIFKLIDFLHYAAAVFSYLEIFHYTRCITLKRAASWRSQLLRHCACRQPSYFGRNVAAVASCWQYCVRFDQPEI